MAAWHMAANGMVQEEDCNRTGSGVKWGILQDRGCQGIVLESYELMTMGGPQIRWLVPGKKPICIHVCSAPIANDIKYSS